MTALDEARQKFAQQYPEHTAWLTSERVKDKIIMAIRGCSLAGEHVDEICRYLAIARNPSIQKNSPYKLVVGNHDVPKHLRKHP